jgi:hypothetical protein
LELIDLCREDEVALGQTVDLVRPDGDLGASPCEQDVGMMTLLLGDDTYAVYELKRLAKVGEPELACEVVFVNNLPLRKLSLERCY